MPYYAWYLTSNELDICYKKRIIYYRGVSVVDQLNTPPPLIPYLKAFISYWRPVVCNDTTKNFQKNLPPKKKIVWHCWLENVQTWSRQRWSRWSRSSPASGRARSTSPSSPGRRDEDQDPEHLKHFQTFFRKKLNSYFVGVEADKPFYVLT